MSRTRPRFSKARQEKWEEAANLLHPGVRGALDLIQERIDEQVCGKSGLPVISDDLPPKDQSLKKDAGKLPLELISDLAEEELARVLAFGAKKYAVDGWRRGMEWRRLIGAAKRHLSKFAQGVDRDDETGLLHVAHAMCCCMFLVEYALTGNGTDDRYKGKK